MVRIKFVLEDIKLKARMFTNSVYFEELDDVTIKLIEAQRVHLINKKPLSEKCRIFCLIENMEDDR